MRGRALELLAEHETEEGADDETLKLLVETAVRCEALGAVTSFPRTRTMLVSLVRGSTFPCGHHHVGVPSQVPSSPAAASGYLVMRPAAPAVPATVMRRQSELLPLAVAQLVEAGNVIGAGMLISSRHVCLGPVCLQREPR